MFRGKNRDVCLGFTAIEVLVVIAIIAILAAILWPVIGKQINKKRVSLLNQNMQSALLGQSSSGVEQLGAVQVGELLAESYPIRLEYYVWDAQEHITDGRLVIIREGDMIVAYRQLTSDRLGDLSDLLGQLRKANGSWPVVYRKLGVASK